MDKDDGLTRLYELRCKAEHLNKQIDDLVAVLKSPDLNGECLATWVEIGAALGVTRQAAQQHYAELSWRG